MIYATRTDGFTNTEFPTLLSHLHRSSDKSAMVIQDNLRRHLTQLTSAAQADYAASNINPRCSPSSLTGTDLTLDPTPSTTQLYVPNITTCVATSPN